MNMVTTEKYINTNRYIITLVTEILNYVDTCIDKYGETR